MRRRSFFKGLLATGLATHASAAGLCAADGQFEKLDAELNSLRNSADAYWARVRSEFQFPSSIAHLNTGSIGASPRVVTGALVDALSKLEADPYHNTWGGLAAGMDETRRQAAEFIGADLDEVCLVRNTTEGMNLVATGLDLQPGDEILTSNHEHGGGMVCWQYLREHRGVKVNYMKMPNPVTDKQQLLQVIERHLTPKTRACSFMHVDTITGMQMPFADIAALTRPRDILLVADAAQTPGMLAVDVKQLGLDALASSSHKWLLAPKGSGLLYVRKEVQDRIHPISLHSGYGAYSASVGTRDVANLLGHGAAIEFHNTIGRERIEARCRQLSMRVRRNLQQIPRLKLLTPEQPELSSGIVSFAVDGMPNGEVHKKLWEEHGLIVKVAQGTYVYTEQQGKLGENYNALRFSTHIYNNESQVDQLAEALEKILA